MSEVISLIREGEVLHACAACSRSTQVIVAAGKQYEIATCFDPETDKWWCNLCYVEEGAEERREAMVQQYKASRQDT